VEPSEQQELKMLAGNEVIRISDQNSLQRAAVYKIRAIYASMHKLSRQENSAGLSIDFFSKNCSFLSTALPEISMRVLKAAGLDTNSHKATVDWDIFLKLYCIFEEGEVKRSKLISFWIKFFDIDLKGFCPELEYMDLLEKLVRGKCMKHKSDFTCVFANKYREQMQQCGVLDDEGAIVIELMQ
jgi:hypothetical protein